MDWVCKTQSRILQKSYLAQVGHIPVMLPHTAKIDYFSSTAFSVIVLSVVLIE
jgi:hypothetical protein